MSTLTSNPPMQEVITRRRRRGGPDAPIGRKQFYRHLMLIAMASVMFYPLAWMLGASFRDDSQIYSPSIWPGQYFTVDGYVEGVGGHRRGAVLRDSCSTPSWCPGSACWAT